MTRETHNHFCMVGMVYFECPATEGKADPQDLPCSPEIADYPTDECPLCFDAKYPILAHVSPDDMRLLLSLYSELGAYNVSLTFEDMERLQALGYVKDLHKIPGRGRYANRYEFSPEYRLGEVITQYYEARAEGLYHPVTGYVRPESDNKAGRGNL